VQTFARVGSDLAIPLALVSDPQTVAAILIGDALKMGLGEYFADKLQGFPWIQQVLGQKNPNIAAITTLIREYILAVPNTNVASVVDVSVTYNPTARSYQYSWAAVLGDGSAVQGGGIV
jgi:hypothetical protein